MSLSQYDVILCDVHLPGINGLDLCRAMKENVHEQTKIIAMSNESSEEFISNCMDAGFDMFVPKPLNEEKLHHLLCVYTIISK